jgi:SAM-dependent methyltransferase
MSEQITERKGEQPPEVLRLVDSQLRREWEEYQASGLQELIGGMHLCLVLDALERTGVAERLRRGPAHPDQLLQGLDAEIGGNLLRYLELKGAVASEEGRYRLTARGQLLMSPISLAQLGFYVAAYGPVISETARLLSGELLYGRDVRRDTGALGRHSATMFHRFHTPTVLKALESVGTRVLLDLGCGGGQLLIDACTLDGQLQGIGIDIAEDAIAYARRRAEEAGVSDRIQFFVADAFAPQSWPAACAGADTICAVGMLHEPFRRGEDAVVEILDLYAGLLRGGTRRFILGEPELRYDDREHDSDFYLAHVLTAQGFPRSWEDWLPVIGRSRLSCRRLLMRPGAGQRLAFFELASGDGEAQA